MIRFTTFGVLMLLSSTVFSQPRVLLVGDSWAAQQWSDGVHNAVFDVMGFADTEALGDTTTTSGSTAAEWNTPTNLQRITDALAANPSIDTVQITLGGNDFLDQWNTGMSQQEVDILQQEILADLSAVVDHTLSLNPRLEVVLSFYDYPNFVDSLGQFLPICDNLHADLGTPTPEQINAAAQTFETANASLATHPRVHHVSHFGLMQNQYGFPDQMIDPGVIQPPGDITLPSPVEAMRVTLTVIDCFHLRAEGYDTLVLNLFDQYFASRFDTIFNGHFE